MNTTAYLHRIGYDGSLDPTAETLRNLHVAHLLSVPLENLDIARGCPILLDENHLFAKIVERGRGGLCYELNGLFAALLSQLGFKVTLLSARVCDGRTIVDFDHMALRVDPPDRSKVWLADVGFGEGFLEPLLLTEGLEQVQGASTYRLTRDAHRWFNARREDGDWDLLYDFTLHPRQFAEFADRCQYHQTSPDSTFTQRRLCSRATPTGRVTLSDMRLIRTENFVHEERLLHSAEEYQAVLRNDFDIEL